MRSRSVLSRVTVTMSRAFIMEKRHVSPQSQLLLESRVLGQIHAVRHCLTVTLSRNGVQSCAYFRAILDHRLRQDQQWWCQRVRAAGAGPFPSGGEWRRVSTPLLGTPLLPRGHEGECLMMPPLCSSSVVPIQFQPFWTLLCFKLISFICFLAGAVSDSMG